VHLRNSGNYTKREEDAAGNEKPLLEPEDGAGEDEDTEDDAGFSDVKLSRSEYDIPEATA